MPQFARPDADTFNGDGWTEDDGDTTNMFQEIDEVSPSDTDFVRSPVTPTNMPSCSKRCHDPVSSSEHRRIRYSATKTAKSYRLYFDFVRATGRGSRELSSTQICPRHY
jgi:hypothetical protein